MGSKRTTTRNARISSRKEDWPLARWQEHADWAAAWLAVELEEKYPSLSVSIGKEGNDFSKLRPAEVAWIKANWDACYEASRKPRD